MTKDRARACLVFFMCALKQWTAGSYSKFREGLLDLVDDVIRRRGARRDADYGRARQPCRIDIVSALNQIRGLGFPADLPEVLGVRALLAADDQNDIDFGVFR